MSASLRPPALGTGSVGRPTAWRPVTFTVLRKVAAGAVVLWATLTASFVALQLAPGDIVTALMGDSPEAPGMRESITREWGLDRSPVEQYLAYLVRAAHGDLGISYTLRKPVTEAVLSQLAPTALLTIVAAVVAIIIAVLSAGVSAGRTRNRRVAISLEVVASSIPEFWLGIVLITVFSFGLRWFPVVANDSPIALVLPAIALGVPLAGPLAQVLRDGMERAERAPFAVSARARGISETSLRVHHLFRHGAAPTVTLTAWTIGGLLGGAIVVEQVFGRPGLGQLAMNAVQSQDLPLVLGIAVLAALVYVVVNTIADITVSIIDPRVRL